MCVYTCVCVYTNTYIYINSIAKSKYIGISEYWYIVNNKATYLLENESHIQVMLVTEK